jgi:hypothetical protein
MMEEVEVELKVGVVEDMVLVVEKAGICQASMLLAWASGLSYWELHLTLTGRLKKTQLWFL